MPRFDISPYLVHFTKGDGDREAFNNLRSIIEQGCIRGGTGNIKGSYICVCFTEAPIRYPDGTINREIYERYSAFGVRFDKETIYEMGGRPVIYESTEEYYHLPDTHRWRHVRYEPASNPPIDWTHEREWRLRTESLNFAPDQVTIIVPSRDYAFRLDADHEREQRFQTYQYSLIMDENIARQYEEGVPWQVAVLDE